MHRRTGFVLGAALAFVAGLSAAACGESDSQVARTTIAPVEAQTTQAALPVVTVYKSPT